MAKTIWKFKLKIVDYQEVEIPVGTTILTLQTTFGNPTLWGIVDTDAKKEKRKFIIFGTGAHIEDDILQSSKYIGTFQVYNGGLVFHVFEKY